MLKVLKRIRDRVGRRKFRIMFSVVFCSPLLIWFWYSDGLKGLLVSLLGLLIGQLICLKLFKD